MGTKQTNEYQQNTLLNKETNRLIFQEILTGCKTIIKWLNDMLWKEIYGCKDGVRDPIQLKRLSKFSNIFHEKLHVQLENVIQYDTKNENENENENEGSSQYKGRGTEADKKVSEQQQSQMEESKAVTKAETKAETKEKDRNDDNTDLAYYGYCPKITSIENANHWLSKTLIYDVITNSNRNNSTGQIDESCGLLLSFRFRFGNLSKDDLRDKKAEMGLGLFQKVSDVVPKERKNHANNDTANNDTANNVNNTNNEQNEQNVEASS